MAEEAEAANAAGPAQPPAVGAAQGLQSKLAKLSLRSDDDFALHLPLRYEDETRLTAIADLRPGVPAQVEAQVSLTEVARRPRRQLICRVADGSGELTLRFINFYPKHLKQLQPGVRLRLFGETRGGFLGAEMVHPRYRLVEEGEPLPAALTPIYSTTAGLGQQPLRRHIEAALARADLRDTLPEPLRIRFALDAVRGQSAHAAPSGAAGRRGGIAGSDSSGLAAHQVRRVAGTAAFAASRLSARRRAKTAPALAPDGTLGARLLAVLPFPLTLAQQRAWAQIAADLAVAHPMQRLLQGDVGSGKTVVAALAALQAIESGYQAALMAPTEILAEQHYRKLAAWLEPLGVTMAWLAGSVKKGERAQALAAIAAGRVQLIVGTHALIEETVEFPRLGLAVVDEQHRFGVRQRLALRDKGARTAYLNRAGAPRHQLMMSATPIPRTLAMSYYADLDVSVLDELPPGRTPVLTKLVADARRDEVIARVRDGLRGGSPGLLGVPADRGVGGAAAADRARDLRAPARGARGSAHRPGARPPEGATRRRR